MTDPAAPAPGLDEQGLRAEIVRLNKIIRALMNRVESSTSMQGSDFDMFQTAIVLEEQVRHRTEELEAALRKVQALQAELREQAIIDPLTGLYNRRYLNETFKRELIRAERLGHPLSVVMADLDKFKDINDTYSHQAGDEALRVFGELLRHHSRGSDIYCRYGGEEFVLVLCDMTEEDACRRAEQLRAEFAAGPITFGAAVIQATASFGVAVFPKHGETGEALIAAADTALYAAKHGGRNQVRRYELQMKP